MPIATAIRISMSIPYLFVPVRYRRCLYVDGGMLCNYPVNVFGEGNKHTLGLKMVTDEEKRNALIKQNRVPIDNIVDFSTGIINLLLLQIERAELTNNYWKQTITINTGHVSTTDFDLSKKDMKFLYRQGKYAVRQFFEEWNSSSWRSHDSDSDSGSDSDSDSDST